ncbi:DUF6443 domain-containing protein [Hymenobacter humi]|uniref:DUF6443 domain-containing protein n=1 Tax=Hymenobacter humi TaxID=1411620 RepID=A0ABW2UDE8_9BACT
MRTRRPAPRRTSTSCAPGCRACPCCPWPRPLPPAPTQVILREEWANVPGGALADVPVHLAPTGTAYLNQLEAPAASGFNYAARVRGYLVAPLTGAYTFWIVGDDAAELYLSPDQDPAHKVLIASCLDYTSSAHDFDRYPAQRSATIQLLANQRYYVEARHKQSWGPGYLAVAWTLPTGARQEPIPATALEPLLDAPADAAPTWPVSAAARTTQYLDGLGRPVQTVQHEASPSLRDLVQPQAYDALGREPRQYLPYAADVTATPANAVGPAGFRYRALTEQAAFYRSTGVPGGGQGPPDPDFAGRGVARTGRAYAETQFEASP